MIGDELNVAMRAAVVLAFGRQHFLLHKESTKPGGCQSAALGAAMPMRWVRRSHRRMALA
jgi:hypothetical protein